MLYPAKWNFSFEKTSEKEGTLLFKATLDKGWHMYSQNTPGIGPDLTAFKFEPSGCYEQVGKVTEPTAHQEYDDALHQNVLTFSDEVTFKQKIKFNGKDGCRIKGIIEYQVCKEACIHLDSAFVFDFGKDNAYHATFMTPASKGTDSIGRTIVVDTAQAFIAPGMYDMLEPDCGKGDHDHEADMSFLGIFLAGMLGGFLALLTPCVFPMIPLTVSFFTKRSKNHKRGIINALIYAASIIVIYVALGLLVTIPLGPDALNDLATNVYFNLAFFIIFVVFAISFFGAFEITLPSALVNKADAASERGGLIGTFFMAFTLSLVSFSCTGPIIGTLLVEAAHGTSYVGPLAGMSGFAVALALPFAVFAAFPAWMHSLPKSGGWLNTVKVALGFLELALALKFLSNVDLAYHWGILKREIFISIWVVIFVMLGIYLLGKLKLSHDSDVKHISIPRLLLALCSLAFALYILPGIWGAPVKALSGILPPEFYKEWKTTSANECPHDLTCFHDFDEGMKYARTQGKPVMIDFTGWNCPNCRRMEDKVWSDPSVLKHLREDYVLISLYVDDKEPLPMNQQYTSPYNGRQIATTGKKWSIFQDSLYKANSQPYYVLIDNNTKLLARPVGYTPKVEEYKEYLEEGLCRYQKRKTSH